MLDTPESQWRRKLLYQTSQEQQLGTQQSDTKDVSVLPGADPHGIDASTAGSI